ncbi:hypothetical protein GGP41_006637 [Bipolaris sorokiniana]|uniref:Uncharacterized protein n=1 Tax=Cochliobolus sativus TaxID=45130 RepID=A0A8H5ZR68_COCSA|nr:hypothetical protein GGP41_006637 [Bipolaris sorokiniana]
MAIRGAMMHASDWHLFSDHGAGGIVKSRHDLIRRMDLPRPGSSNERNSYAQDSRALGYCKKRASNNDKVEQLFLPTLLLFSTLSLADKHTDAVGSTPQSPVILQIPELATMLLCRPGRRPVDVAPKRRLHLSGFRLQTTPADQWYRVNHALSKKSRKKASVADDPLGRVTASSLGCEAGGATPTRRISSCGLDGTLLRKDATLFAYSQPAATAGFSSLGLVQSGSRGPVLVKGLHLHVERVRRITSSQRSGYAGVVSGMAKCVRLCCNCFIGSWTLQWKVTTPIAVVPLSTSSLFVRPTKHMHVDMYCSSVITSPFCSSTQRTNKSVMATTHHVISQDQVASHAAYMNLVRSACPCLLPTALTRSVPPVPPRQDSTMADEGAVSIV